MYKYKKKGKTLPFLYPPSHGPKVIFWTQMGPLVWTDPPAALRPIQRRKQLCLSILLKRTQVP